MKPGDVRKVAFTFDVGQQLADHEAKVELSVGDRDLREVASEKIKIPIEPAAPLVAAAGRGSRGSTGALALRRTQAGARAFGKLAQDAALRALGKGGRLRQGRSGERPLRVRLGQRRDRGRRACRLAGVRRHLQPRSAHDRRGSRRSRHPRRAHQGAAPRRAT